MIRKDCLAAALLAAMTGSSGAYAVQVTLIDACGRSVVGTPGAANSVDSSGNLTISQFAAPYAAMFGACESPVPTTPECTLSASQTRLAPGTSATLFAKCTSAPTSYTWNTPSDGPALPANSGTVGTFPLTFPAAGAYTYSLSASNGSGAGPLSNQLTILVGDDTKKPICSLTASPVAPVQGSKSKLQVVCHPTSTSYVWTADSGAPAAPSGASGEPTFPVAGTFTYKVQGVNGNGAGPMASATVTVSAGMAAAKAFAPASIGAGGTSVLTITLTNQNSVDATGVAFTDAYPTNLVNATPANAATTCAGGAVSATNGGSNVALSGATIPASGSCAVTVNVTSASAGSYANSTGAISTSNMGNGPSGSATLTVLARPTIAKAFSPASANVNANSTLTVTLSNSNATAITGAAFTDTYPAGLVNAASANGATTCAGGTVTAANNETSLALTGATIPASGSCTVTVSTTSATSGSYANTIPAGALTTSNAGTNASAASATLTVSTCTAGGYSYNIAMAPNSYSQDVVTQHLTVAAFSFSTSTTSARINITNHTAYTTYPIPVGDWVISRCIGDFNVTGPCRMTGMGEYGSMTAYTSGNPATQCLIEPNTTYYLNFRQTSCSEPSGVCGFRMNRNQ